MQTSRDAVAAARRALLAPLIAATAVSVAGVIIIAFMELGPLSRHMTLHIASMNVAAPIAAASYRSFGLVTASPGRSRLWLATLAQLGLLWAWHSPALQSATHSSPLSSAVLHISLFLAALVFWLAVIDAVLARWEAILALLVSGKLVCLLGALLIFAPRPLYEPMAHHVAAHALATSAASGMADQQLAGLLMIAACPLSFVVAAIVLAAQSITDLQRIARSTPPGRTIYGG